MRGRFVMGVGWPAFLAACVLELVVFAVVDPLEMQGLAAGHGLSRQAIYTLAFAVFWAITLGAGALTALLVQPAPPRGDAARMP